jgi:hypothetical protein
MLKDKIETLKSRGKIIQFYWISRYCGIEVNERADSEAKQAIQGGRDSQLLLSVADLKTLWKKKGKEELHSFLKTQKGTEEKDNLKVTTGMVRLRGSARSK